MVWPLEMHLRALNLTVYGILTNKLIVLTLLGARRVTYTKCIREMMN